VAFDAVARTVTLVLIVVLAAGLTLRPGPGAPSRETQGEHASADGERPPTPDPAAPGADRAPG
jgi:hypothetical protein